MQERIFTKGKIECTLSGTYSGRASYFSNMQRKFSQKEGLKKHLLIHIGEKPRICESCNKEFSEEGNLQEHFWTHTGEKSHVCEVMFTKLVTKNFH